MATLSLRIRDDLKRKAQELAKRKGVSLNNYIKYHARGNGRASGNSCGFRGTAEGRRFGGVSRTGVDVHARGRARWRAFHCRAERRDGGPLLKHPLNAVRLRHSSTRARTPNTHIEPTSVLSAG